MVCGAWNNNGLHKQRGAYKRRGAHGVANKVAGRVG